MERKRNTAETKEEIIQSAIRLFEAQGYSKTTLEQIAAGANMTRGAFYWNFKTKKDLLDEIEKRYERFYRSIYDEVVEQESALETLRILLKTNLVKKLTPSPYSIMLRYKIESAIELKELIERQQNLDYQFISFIKNQVQRGIAQNEFSKEINAEEVAFYIYSFLLGFDSFVMTHSLNAESKFSPDKEMISRYVEKILKVLHH